MPNSSLFAWGAFIHRRKKQVLILTGAFLVLSIALLVRGGALTGGKIDGLEAERAQSVADQVLGRRSDTSLLVVVRPARPGVHVDDDVFVAALNQAVAPLRSDPRVLGVTTPAEAPPLMAPRMVNRRTDSVLIFVALRGEVRDALETYPDVRRKLHSDALSFRVTGQLAFMHDLDETLESDLLFAELISLPLALLVLLWVFRTPLAALLPVGVGALAVLGGIAFITALSRVVDVAQYAINVSSLVGLGVAIDYSLFMVSRFREELARGLTESEALGRTMDTAGRVVAFSGVAVGTGMAGLFFFRGSYLWALGLGGSTVVLLAVVFALTFLPALLALFGRRLVERRPRPASDGGPWHAVAVWVMRRPLAVMIPTLGLLLAMGLPFFHLRVTAADVRVLSPRVEARDGYEQLRADFPDLAATRIEVAVRFPSAPTLSAERVGALFDLSRRISALPHVRRVESIVDSERAQDGAADQQVDFEAQKRQLQAVLVNPPPMAALLVEEAKRLTVGDKVAVLHVITDRAPESPEAHAIVRAIRAERRVGDGALEVGGATANDIDSAAFITARIPRAVGFVMGVTALILFLLLRSLLLPIKALIMNALSVLASLGALVYVYQDGHLFVSEPRPLEPSLPILLFCVLFGVSMDYEVLMLARMKEAYETSRDNTGAVAIGLARSAGLITSAAAIMVVVFSAFSFSRVVLVQSVGVGMALAVALDATVVRALLVPATMRLFGHLNWWPGVKRS